MPPPKAPSVIREDPLPSREVLQKSGLLQPPPRANQAKSDRMEGTQPRRLSQTGEPESPSAEGENAELHFERSFARAYEAKKAKIRKLAETDEQGRMGSVECPIKAYPAAGPTPLQDPRPPTQDVRSSPLENEARGASTRTEYPQIGSDKDHMEDTYGLPDGQGSSGSAALSQPDRIESVKSRSVVTPQASDRSNEPSMQESKPDSIVITDGQPSHGSVFGDAEAVRKELLALSVGSGPSKELPPLVLPELSAEIYGSYKGDLRRIWLERAHALEKEGCYSPGDIFLLDHFLVNADGHQ